MDPDRARQLYVSKDPKDQSLGTDFQADIAAREKTAARYPELCKGIIDFKTVKYRSNVGDLDMPAYLFQPLDKRGPKGHAAMIWVHGGVHGNWGITMFPFVKEAVARGYVIIAPDYRGSTGYGEAHHQAIDYGGKEVDDVISAVGLPEDAAARRSGAHRHDGLEPRRLHHAAVGLPRQAPVRGRRGDRAGDQPRLPPVATRGRATSGTSRPRRRSRGCRSRSREIYIQRSPLYHVDKLQVPLLVHVATNDTDVDYVEDQQIVDALRSRKPDLAETKTYVDPPRWGASGGHAFSRRVDPNTLQRVESPDQIDSWNRTWTFFEWVLRPYEDRSKPVTYVDQAPGGGRK